MTPINTTLDSERIATLTRERDEARAELARLKVAIQTCSGSWVVCLRALKRGGK